MDIVVRRKYTPQEIRSASLKATEFKPNRYTSGCANLDDMIALGKAVILCATHVRKFRPMAVHYRAHPDKNLRRVFGNCDVCKQCELGFLFLNGKDADEEEKKLNRFNWALQHGNLFTC